MTHCVVSYGDTRLFGGIGFGAVQLRIVTIDCGDVVFRFTRPTSASVPVLTDQRSTPQLPLLALGVAISSSCSSSLVYDMCATFCCAAFARTAPPSSIAMLQNKRLYIFSSQKMSTISIHEPIGPRRFSRGSLGVPQCAGCIRAVPLSGRRAPAPLHQPSPEGGAARGAQ